MDCSSVLSVADLLLVSERSVIIYLFEQYTSETTIIIIPVGIDLRRENLTSIDVRC